MQHKFFKSSTNSKKTVGPRPAINRSTKRKKSIHNVQPSMLVKTKASKRKYDVESAADQSAQPPRLSHVTNINELHFIVWLTRFCCATSRIKLAAKSWQRFASNNRWTGASARWGEPSSLGSWTFSARGPSSRVSWWFRLRSDVYLKFYNKEYQTVNRFYRICSVMNLKQVCQLSHMKKLKLRNKVHCQRSTPPLHFQLIKSGNFWLVNL